MQQRRSLTLALSLVTVLAGLGCGPTEPPRLQIGEACSPTAAGETAPECATGLCVALDTASGFCTAPCDSDEQCPPEGFVCEAAGKYGKICKKLSGCERDGECPAGHSCNTETGNCYLKVQRTLCSPCQDALQCPQGGTCFTAVGSGEQFCTSPCAAGDVCPTGFECRGIPAGQNGAMIKQCVPQTQTCSAGRPVCAPCKGDAECGGHIDLCVRNVVSGETFCGRDCHPSRAGDCPTGFSCVDIGQSDDPNKDGPFQCVPNANTCEGFCSAADELGQIRECGLGRTCNAAANQCEPAADGRMCSPCTNNDDCRSGGHPENRCIQNDCPDCPFKGESFCSTPCLDDAACTRSFGPGFVCRPVANAAGGTDNFCMPQRGSCAVGLGRVGDDCSVGGAEDCVAGVCVVAGLTEICSAPCSKDIDCGDSRFRCCESAAEGQGGYDCDPSKRNPDGPVSGSGVCAPMGGLFGDDCTPGRPPCQTGSCLDLGTSRVCTSVCATDGDCPNAFTCRTAEPLGGGAQVKVCFPEGGGGAGADCSFGPAACGTGLCIKKDSGNVCTQLCQADGDCPDEWFCDILATVDGQSVQACLPPSLQ